MLRGLAARAGLGGAVACLGLGIAPATPKGAVALQPAVGLRVLRLVDRSRSIEQPGGRREPRVLVTYVRYPAVAGADATDTTAPASSGATDVRNAAPAQGERPLIVFAHGYDVTPGPYARLLQSWARAGFVVAAPVFPLTNPAAPGGLDERDVVNQPADVSFAISSLVALSGTDGGPLSGTIDPREIAVAGHSDGAETALALAYSRRYRDQRVRAAAVLSGAQMSGIGGYGFAGEQVPLLAAQGTKDGFNEPRYTRAYFKAAPAPKYLLWLLGAGHLPPYSYQQPYLGVVERTTTAFFERYLTGETGALTRIGASGNVAKTSKVVADP